jgi:hypothetical protein
MLLNGLERLVLLNQVLPAEGNALTMKLVYDVRAQLGLNEDELKDLGVTPGSPQQMGNDALEELTEKEVEIGTLLNSIIVGILQKLGKDEKLTVQHVGLCAKFGVT